MKFRIHASGYALMARALAGSGEHVDTMRVELDTRPDAGDDTPFGAERPFTQLPATGTVTGGAVRFSGLLRACDVEGWTPGKKITRATLMCGSVPVATSVVEPPVELADSAYTSVNVEIRFGSDNG